ncbi:MAG: hypothetical protein GY796_35330 [Chloroflexi bacterium]|nr:hypothetical protein [Chloroflexota bacterium]
MVTVIGLFAKDEDAQYTIYALQNAGLARDKISVLVYEDTVQKFLAGNQKIIWSKSTRVGGGFLGVVIFDLYGLTLSGYARTNLLGYSSLSFWIFILALLTAMGADLGTFAGRFFGTEKLDRSIRPYIWSMHQGGALVVAQVDRKLASKVIDVLHQENGTAIKALQSRFGSFWQRESVMF